MNRLRIAGVRACGSGYPNAEQTIRILRAYDVALISDLGYSLPDSLHLWRFRNQTAFGKVTTMVRIGLWNTLSFLRVLAAREDRNVPVYIPYPSIFFLWLLSWVPTAVRPRCIADAYISIWDSLFRDRRGGELSLPARLTKSFEGRALRAATLVLVDTKANKDMMVADFDLTPERVFAWPLAIDEARFRRCNEPEPTHGRIKVLFVGTLIPLHGLPVLLDAIRTLQSEARFDFRIIGDGQQAPLVEQFMLEFPGVGLTWKREWCSLDEIAAEIAAADICLGVFGGDAKAARVLPFKLYMYLASGKPVITQSKLSTPEGVPFPPVEAIDVGHEHELANGIRRLADDAALRGQRGSEGRAYYRQWLANSELAQRWAGALRLFVSDP